MLVGGHVSAAGGIFNAPENAVRIGANCMQVFGSSPRQWKVRQPDAEALAEYKRVQEKSKISPVYLHAPYLINLATPKKSLLAQSAEALKGHFQIANMVGAEGLVFHLGSHKDSTLKKGIAQTVSEMKRVIKTVPGDSQLIMEISSGGGNKLGDNLEELAELFSKVNSKRVSLCLDTAHAFTAGLIDYSPASISSFIKKWDKLIGLENINVLHMNDSKADFGSKVDRHENLGRGKIGLKGLAGFARRREFRRLPWILEVPGVDKSGPDKKNINILKKMLK